MAADGSYIPANVSRESWINVETEVEQSMQSYLDSLDEELSNQLGFKKPPTKIVRKCRTTSQTDPDSGYINHGSKRGICSPGAGASGHYRIYPRNSVLQST